MPIDPSILRSAPFTPTFRTPGQFDAEMAQRDALTARAGEDLAQVQRAQQLRAIVQKHGGDIEKAAPEIAALDPELGQRIYASVTGRQQQQRVTQGEQAKAQADRLDALDKGLVFLLDPKMPEQARQSYLQGVQQRYQQEGFAPPADINEVKQRLGRFTTGQDIGNVLFPTTPAAPAFGSEADYLTRKYGPNPTPEQMLEGRKAYGGQAAPKAATLGSFEDYVTRTYGENPTSAQVLKARKEYNQSDDRPRIEVTTAPGGPGGYTPEGLDYDATRARITGQYPGRNAQVNAQIANRIAEQNKMLGQSPVAAVQKQAAYKGDAAALQDITKRAASAEAFEAKALGQIPIIEELSAKVSRTSMPVINAALQSGRTEITGNSNATQLANAIETFTEEYAKIMGGSTGSAAGATDSSRAAAKRLLNTAMSKGTMTDVLALMQREMALTMQGYDATKSHITERMSGGVVPPPGGGAPKATHRFNPQTGKIEAIP